VVYRPSGQGSGPPKRFKLGRYPSELSLAEARKEAAAVRDKIRQGLDPAIERVAAIAEQRQAELEQALREEELANRLSVAQLAEEFLAAKARLKWGHRYRWMLGKDVLPFLGTRAAEDITSADITDVIDRIIQRGSPGQARKVFECIRAMFSWAVKRLRLTTTPMTGVEPPPKSQPRERVLSAAEVRAIWAALDAGAVPLSFARIIRLALLLGQRSAEISGMTRSELSADFYEWSIPGNRTKNKRPHWVPLPPLARAIVTEAIADAGASTCIFPGSTGKAIRSDTTAGKVKDLVGSLGFVDATGQPAHATLHDVRRTVATRLEEMHPPTPRPVVDAILNHVSAKAASVTSKHYVHADLRTAMREALTHWQRALVEIVGGGDPFRARREQNAEEIEARILKPTDEIVPLRRVSGNHPTGTTTARPSPIIAARK
jgi:integrase